MVLFAGFSSVSTVPAGSFSKASLVGANTVNGPFDFSVATNPAALTAATRVVWSCEFIALSTMSFALSMGEPPTIGFMSVAFICAYAGWLAIAIDATANSTMTNTFFTASYLPLLEEMFLELGEYTEFTG